MARDWEAQFRDWAKPPAKTEQERCDNAVSAVRNAIRANDKLRAKDIQIFAQGSYKNNTNVRKDSDVDVGILCTNTFFFDLPKGLTKEMFGITPATYDYAQFKNEVEEALVTYFGRTAVKRGNKAFNIHETKYHVEADVAAFFEYRNYLPDWNCHTGVAMLTNKEHVMVINWPEQHYTNGCQKNTKTGTRFKSIVRVLKALSNEMAEQVIPGGEIPSFLTECLVWNVPNTLFQNESYVADARKAVRFLFHNTKTDELCQRWREVSELKHLFGGHQKWTHGQANQFALATWGYAGFGK